MTTATYYVSEITVRQWMNLGGDLAPLEARVTAEDQHGARHEFTVEGRDASEYRIGQRITVEVAAEPGTPTRERIQA